MTAVAQIQKPQNLDYIGIYEYYSVFQILDGERKVAIARYTLFQKFEKGVVQCLATLLKL